MKCEVFDAHDNTAMQMLSPPANSCNTCLTHEQGNIAADGFLKNRLYRNLSLVYGNIHLPLARQIRFGQKAPVVKMVFQFCGSREILLNGLDEKINICNNRHLLIYTTQNKGYMRFSGCPHQHFLEIDLHPLFAKKYLSDNDVFASFIRHIKAQQSFLFNRHAGTITAPMKQIISELVNNVYDGPLEQLFIESKIMQLLFLQIDHFLAINHKIQTPPFRKEHAKKIFLAKSIIEKNIAEPCSLINLARQAGTNEFTLKKGFREILGTTVFTYWNDLKMQKAYKMLQAGNSSITEIAYDSGFKTVQYFTTAFKKRFGATPNAVKKLYAKLPTSDKLHPR